MEFGGLEALGRGWAIPGLAGGTRRRTQPTVVTATALLAVPFCCQVTQSGEVASCETGSAEGASPRPRPVAASTGDYAGWPPHPRVVADPTDREQWWSFPTTRTLFDHAIGTARSAGDRPHPSDRQQSTRARTDVRDTVYAKMR